MSLIKCPECNQMISDEALACPHCGKPLKSINKQESKTKISIWGINPPHVIWNAGMFKTILEIDGIKYGTIPMKNKYDLYIDRDCQLTFSINGTKPVSYNVKKGEDETIELVYDNTMGGISIKGKRGNVSAKGCMVTMLMLGSVGAMLSLAICLILNCFDQFL